ncbi:23S rRNA (guanosine(2251)-2'-O)-methyltransferase RlmB [soil metagenome]
MAQRHRRGERTSQSKDDATRRRPELEFVYGRNAVYECLFGRRSHRRVYIADGIELNARVHEVRNQALLLGLSVESAPRRTIDDLVRGANHQGVVLETSRFVYDSLQEILDAKGNALALDHLTDPQNFGTLLRSAEAFGVSAAIIPKDRSVEVTPAVVSSSSGAVEHLQISQVTNLSRALGEAKIAGYWVVGLDRTDSAAPLRSIGSIEPFILVVGAEGSGMSPSINRQCDFVAAIEQRGAIDSLNAAVAGSIALYHLTSDSLELKAKPADSDLKAEPPQRIVT